MKRSRLLVGFLAGLVVLLSSAVGFSQLPPDIPRNETLILEQIFRHRITANYNAWMEAPVVLRHVFVYDTLWYIDQQTGEWTNSLAKEPPIYNEDFTEMTVKLRKGIYWSDGVEFTADDVVYTVETLKSHPQMQWGATFDIYVDEVYKTDDYTVVFKLTKPHSRFHTEFTVKFFGCYIMPKHVWEKVEDPTTFTFYPPVSLGQYVLKDLDLAGYWELYERREDWQRTTVGKICGNKAPPKYVLSIFYGPSEKKVMAMAQRKLDCFMNIDYEAFQSLLRKDPYARSWYKDYPWAWLDELECRWLGFNLEKSPYDIKDVRWALALALDIVELQTEYLNGITKVNPIPEPAAPLLMKYYHKPLESWLKGFKLEIEDGVYFKPYDPTVPERIVKWAEKRGYPVPREQKDIEEMFGMGWWKHAPEVAEKLLKKHGFRRDATGKWLLPDGTPWEIKILTAPDEVDTFRITLGAADQWEKFGVKAEVDALEREPYYSRINIGDFTSASAWSAGVEASLTVDKWPYLYKLHSMFYRPSGTPCVGGWSGNKLRMKSDDLDRLIDKMAPLHPEDPQILELGKEVMKLWVENMWSIVLFSYKKFITQSEYYWTHFPTAEDPYRAPCYWYLGGRWTLPYLEPTGRK